MTIAPEIWTIDRAGYHAARDLVGSSSLKLLAESPLAYKSKLDGLLPDDDSTPDTLIGTAVDIAWTEPDLFCTEVAVQPKDFGPAPGTVARRKAWKAGNRHRSVILDHESGKIVLGCTFALDADPTAKKIREKPGRAQVAIRWTDPNYGIACKALIDWLCLDDGLLFDLKTIRGYPTPRARSRRIEELKYHWQAAHYLEGAELVFGKPMEWCWVWVGKDPIRMVNVPAIGLIPVGEVVVSEIGSTTLRIAQRQRANVLAEMRRRLDTGDWSSTTPGAIETDELPEWVIRREA